MKSTTFHTKLIRQPIKAVLISLLIAFNSTLIAEELMTPVSKQGNQSIQTPRNGQKMELVEANFGAPMEKVTSVGEPPISKWVYRDFTVYLEHDIVLHAVLHKL